MQASDKTNLCYIPQRTESFILDGTKLRCRQIFFNNPWPYLIVYEQNLTHFYPIMRTNYKLSILFLKRLNLLEVILTWRVSSCRVETVIFS